MDLLFLGTGAGIPAKLRNVTSIALKMLEERKTIWLFDCGEATQHQILHTSLKPRKIEKIFITHLHGDHIYGLPGLLGSRSFQAGHSELTVYGPKGIKEYIDVSLKVSETHLQYPLVIEEIKEGIVFEDDQFVVEAAVLEHGIHSFGYRITEKDRKGTLDVDKLRNDGIMPGPIYAKLKSGETVQLEDGRIINGNDYVGPDQKGKIITILGDTRYCENARNLAQNADVLVHEATFSAENEELAFDYFHSTTKQAATIASEANVRTLCLTHISSRYGKDDWPQLVKEAEKVFPNSLIAHDFMEIKIK
ncbi:ribonuclease Z [Heyndrickxia sporothermodurans]|uniref:ribonuclease Z n=1 Tax=Heyndrickxia sporothermodurans TaxID=46224 RepID=UPI002DBFFB00|nr:ribonuclease Z [Heyndrickxia sporothermodurans]MEB6547580.1 ribonuclease Z [Heyndrickxia sporothermodurans]MED3650897.1 ribonuclease Z [Heyndrickxia sporothermodurans]MED3655220.1 ribonuclease Z [Heyndrickxia sporothermodurans]MED3699662.1 ribonuclease Z [Heyndrickxia sporothermodurans]MED3780822.1 ribonuclease Z [Heyndrickxia sporothermodurans]